jgi:hypothetical protein
MEVASMCPIFHYVRYVESVFLLSMRLFQRILSEGDKLYCAFIAYEKAFDRVDRNMLWHKPIKEGTSLTTFGLMSLSLTKE